MEVFLLDNFLDLKSERFHLARTTINSNDTLSLHSHNYVEIFWIKSGQGIHCINGEKIRIGKGLLCMIRPGDHHTFEVGLDDKHMVITNIAFHPESLEQYKARYFPGSETYFWSDEPLPFCIQLDSSHLNKLSSRTDQLFGEARGYLQLDYILITIFRLINSLENQQINIPHWLTYAMNNYNTPEHFMKGISGFVELTGHSTAHVNRSLQKHLKQTLTETVVKIRLSYASQQLIMTNASVKTICDDCGFRSLSYFYRLFKNHLGYTPVEYRRMNHKVF